MLADNGAPRKAVRVLRRSLGAGIAGIWEWLLAQPVLQTQGESRAWTPDGKGRVLVVAPHPDDEAAGCAGAIALHRRSGNEVTVACVTDGTGSTALRGSPKERSAQRRNELENALSILGVESLQWMDLVENRWTLEQGVAALGRVLDDIRPTMIYSPSRVDFHPEHRKVAQALALAISTVSCVSTVRVYPVLVPLAQPLADLHLDVTGLREIIVKALRAHRSQWGTLERTLRRRRYAAACAQCRGLVEEFWSLGSDTFARIHADPAAGESFRGLRYDPWTDPLAFLVGRSAKYRIRAEAARFSDGMNMSSVNR